MTEKPAAPEKKGDMKQYIVTFIALLLAALGVWDAYTESRYIGGDKPISLEAFLGGIFAVWGVVFLTPFFKGRDNKQSANQTDQGNSYSDKEISDRFIDSVALLGNNSPSARMGAIFSLYQLAMDSDKYCGRVAQALCSHIRSKTQEKEYQAQYKNRPSNEIQTAIDILFRDVKGVKGLYCHDFAQEVKFPRANLSHAHLCGADFREAQCQGADFKSSRCYNADFANAHCQKANFPAAKCIGVSFPHARLYGACFDYAECQGAFFRFAMCQGASFFRAYFNDADFSGAKCQGANFFSSEFQSASVSEETNLCGAYGEFGNRSLEDRIGRDTEIRTTAIFEGEWSSGCVEAIEAAKPYISHQQYQDIKRTAAFAKRRERSNQFPFYVTSGVLEDGEEIREIVEEIRKWER